MEIGNFIESDTILLLVKKVKCMKEQKAKCINEHENYISYITLASVISCLAVIYMHVNGCFWIFPSTAGYWPSANVIECICYFAVPVFFMITGSTLLDFFDHYGLKTYMRKRVNKTLLPYIIWSMIGLSYQVFVDKSIALSDVTLKYIIKGLLQGSLVKIYWYFVALFSVYLSLPLFAAVEKEKREKIYLYVFLIGFGINSLIPFLSKLAGISFAFPYSVQVVSGYLLFLPLGWLLSHCEIGRKYRFLIYIMGIGGLLMHLLGTYALSMKAGQIVGTFKGYDNVPCILYSIAIFIFLRYESPKLMKIFWLRKFVETVGKYTFGVYLIHIYIVWILLHFFDYTSLLYRVVAPPIILLIAVCIIWLVRKLPFGKHILP